MFSFISTLLVAVALAMDAFSVSMTKGFTQKDLTKSQILYYALFFGGFQAFMPIIGYFCGNVIASVVTSLAPIIGFILLVAIGVNMIRETSGDRYEEARSLNQRLTFKSAESYFKRREVSFGLSVTLGIGKLPFIHQYTTRNDGAIFDKAFPCQQIHA